MAWIQGGRPWCFLCGRRRRVLLRRLQTLLQSRVEVVKEVGEEQIYRKSKECESKVVKFLCRVIRGRDFPCPFYCSTRKLRAWRSVFSGKDLSSRESISPHTDAKSHTRTGKSGRTSPCGGHTWFNFCVKTIINSLIQPTIHPGRRTSVHTLLFRPSQPSHYSSSYKCRLQLRDNN